MALCRGKVDTKTFPTIYTKELVNNPHKCALSHTAAAAASPTSAASMPKRLGPHNHTNPIIWCLSIICAILTLIVIIAGIVVFIGYITIRPKVPRISVASAHLDTIYLDEASLLTLHLTILIKAENHNTKARASFYDVRYALSFHGHNIALLMAAPFHVRANKSVDLGFFVKSDSIPLSAEEADAVNVALRQNVIDLRLKGTARTRWRVGLVGSVKFRLHLDCQLHLPVDGAAVYPAGCSSRSQ